MNLYIIAGPNGAGKTTFAREFLPRYVECFEFINADMIADGLAPFKPEQAAVRAGKITLNQIHSLSAQKVDFGFETTLAGKSYIHHLRELRKQGYYICLFYLWLPDVALALQRIADRVWHGGHNVPEKIVRRRYQRGLTNFITAYRPLVDLWMIIDNSTLFPRVSAYNFHEKKLIIDHNVYETIIRQVENK